MTEEEYEKQIIRCFDIFGQALWLTVKAATQPAAGQYHEEAMAQSR